MPAGQLPVRKQPPALLGLLLPTRGAQGDGVGTTPGRCKGITCGEGITCCKAQPVAGQQKEHGETWVANALTKGETSVSTLLPCQASCEQMGRYPEQ